MARLRNDRTVRREDGRSSPSHGRAVEIGDLAGRHTRQVDALVDTGATYTLLPADLLLGLGLSPEEQRGRATRTIAIFGEAGSDPLLGAFTLEGLGLAADPVNRRLISVAGRLKPAAPPSPPPSRWSQPARSRAVAPPC